MWKKLGTAWQLTVDMKLFCKIHTGLILYTASILNWESGRYQAYI